MSKPMTCPPEVRIALDDIRARLETQTSLATRPSGTIPQTEELVNQCRAALARHRAARPPVRMVHHLACTGGTLISKCLAALPNVLMLSEIDPLGTLHLPPARQPFFPTDMISSLRYDPRGLPDKTAERMFLAALEALHQTTSEEGRHLVLRGHPHSQYCVRSDPEARPSLQAIVSRVMPSLAILTVRHPLDSFLSLDVNGWHHFEPFTLDEYARRYLLFLNNHAALPRYRYEDFVSDPETTLSQMAKNLQLPMSPAFETTMSLFVLSGQSGRTGLRIAARPRRNIPQTVADSIGKSAHYTELCALLEYDTDV